MYSLSVPVSKMKQMEDKKKQDEKETDMMLAFRLFDANNKGYIESADLRFIILNMDNRIPRDELNEMITSAKLDQDRRVTYEGKQLSIQFIVDRVNIKKFLSLKQHIFLK